jgi:NADH dehydrogenase/NADH:ubiquinone oxidoreductase subunit G
MISLIIDGQPIEVSEGTTLLEACRQLSINIPTLCYYQAIEPYGGCRLCLVEAGQGGRSRLTTACTAPAEEGLVVITHSERIVQARKRCRRSEN